MTAYSFQASWAIWRTATLGPDKVQAGQIKTAFLCGTYPGINFKSLPGMPYREDPNYSNLMTKSYLDIGRHVIRQIQEDPGRYLGWWLIGKPVMYWSWKVFFSDGINFYPVLYTWFDINPLMRTLRSVMLSAHPAVVLIALLGIGLFIVKPNSADSTAVIAYLLCFALLSHFTLIFMILAPFPRYALPLGPELYIMSTFSLWKGYVWIRERVKHV